MSRNRAAELARYGKLKLIKRRMARRVRGQIASHNSEVTRRTQLIDVDDTRTGTSRARLTRAQAEALVPSAILSACWAKSAATKLSPTRPAWRMRAKRGQLRAKCDPVAPVSVKQTAPDF